ncbi:LLM class flavin-dependent oxidoreductase [Lentzea sp. JNUCC 0626]|uniref:LLM class flavin-dependent oxidoreductase n=1 Tax=Lentzea sp. JNUCC 0626 TaxID=3367513 RepID=UPI0037480C90
MHLAIMVDGENGLSASAWLDLAQTADAIGVEALLRSDHYAGAEPADCLDAWTAISAAAARTSRVRLGTLVSPVTFRPPAVLAKIAASVTAIGGRAVDVGLGIGWNEHEHRASGLPFPPASVRYRMAAEQAEILTGLWTGPFSFDGEFHRLDGADHRPRPEPRPRLVIGKRGGPRSLAFAARWADEYNLVFVTPQRCAEVRTALARHCTESGRSTVPPLSVMTDFTVGRTESEVADRLAAAAVHNPFLRGVAAADLPEPYLAGTPATLVAALRRYQEQGVSRMILKLPDPTDHECLALLADEVLPHFPTQEV